MKKFSIIGKRLIFGIHNLLFGRVFTEYGSVCKALGLFAPNSVTWAGPRARAELTIASVNDSWSALGKLLQREYELHSVEVTDLEQVRIAESDCSALASRLSESLRNHGSDKSTKHNYHILYAQILDAINKDAPRMLEIRMGTNNTDVPSNMGVAGSPGGSLRAWREVIADAQIFGADVDRRILFEEERIKTFFVDQTDPNTITELFRTIGVGLDLVIDDGLHSPHANLNTVIAALEWLPDGGWVVVEDIPDRSVPVWKLVGGILQKVHNVWLIRMSRENVFVIQKCGVKMREEPMSGEA